LKNVLIDKQVSNLADDEHKELLKDFDKTYVVGVAMKQTSFDENCASFCMDNNCDFLTAEFLYRYPLLVFLLAGFCIS